MRIVTISLLCGLSGILNSGGEADANYAQGNTSVAVFLLGFTLSRIGCVLVLETKFADMVFGNQDARNPPGHEKV